ncbi:hypothetical protein [Pseudodesulfovibrio sp.]|uniref:hypothetical protein n=1 Tax=unclassified Pseudodesulfovibrio TaxID=2661612 RepID=UPI003B008212
MAKGRIATLIRLGKPVLAGLALAYFATGFVDRPAPVHFQPENPYAAQQTAIVESPVDLVVEKNILKLGSPLSVPAVERVPEENPLAALEGKASVPEDSTPSEEAVPLSANGTDMGQDNATPAVRGEVDAATAP